MANELRKCIRDKFAEAARECSKGPDVDKCDVNPIDLSDIIPDTLKVVDGWDKLFTGKPAFDDLLRFSEWSNTVPVQFLRMNSGELDRRLRDTQTTARGLMRAMMGRCVRGKLGA